MDSSMMEAGVNVGLAAAGLVEEVAQHVHALRGVDDLGVELHGVEAAPRSSMAATGAPPLLASVRNRAGGP